MTNPNISLSHREIMNAAIAQKKGVLHKTMQNLEMGTYWKKGQRQGEKKNEEDTIAVVATHDDMFVFHKMIMSISIVR